MMMITRRRTTRRRGPSILLMVMVLAGFVGACSSGGVAPLPVAAPVADVVAFDPDPDPDLPQTVWSARPGVTVFDGVATAYAVERAFTRLDVVGRDSLGLRMVCVGCPEPLEGYVAEEDVIFQHVPPEVAAWGDLADFALSVRMAAEQHDIRALRPVMAADFSFSFVGIQTVETAIAVWEGEQFTTLARVPGLLDRGLSTRDGRIWSAPPDFIQDLRYQGLRTGFHRRSDGRWEWLYLIRGIADR